MGQERVMAGQRHRIQTVRLPSENWTCTLHLFSDHEESARSFAPAADSSLYYFNRPESILEGSTAADIFRAAADDARAAGEFSA